MDSNGNIVEKFEKLKVDTCSDTQTDPQNVEKISEDGNNEMVTATSDTKLKVEEKDTCADDQSTLESVEKICASIKMEIELWKETLELISSLQADNQWAPQSDEMNKFKQELVKEKLEFTVEGKTLSLDETKNVIEGYLKIRKEELDVLENFKHDLQTKANSTEEGSPTISDDKGPLPVKNKVKPPKVPKKKTKKSKKSQSVE